MANGSVYKYPIILADFGIVEYCPHQTDYGTSHALMAYNKFFFLNSVDFWTHFHCHVPIRMVSDQVLASMWGQTHGQWPTSVLWALRCPVR